VFVFLSDLDHLVKLRLAHASRFSLGETMRRISRSRAVRRRFIDRLANTANVSVACAHSRMSRGFAYKWREEDSDFAEDWNKALNMGLAAAEDELVRRAVAGVREPVYYQGARIGTMKRYSDILLMFLLKAHNPEKYRERAEITHSGELLLRQQGGARERLLTQIRGTGDGLISADPEPVRLPS